MKYKISLNGKDYLVEVERGEAILLDVQDTPAAVPVQEAAAPSPAAVASAATTTPAAAATGSEAVPAPMNGLILSVAAKVGDHLKAGQVLCILEAMKMENEIACPRDAVITSVEVDKGAHVETGQTLFTLE